ncbi:MAG: ATP-dependent helicase [Lachnospiraceae bacterium]|nr:ATP-dependent helicase [Lachnospiraceae bacterium]
MTRSDTLNPRQQLAVTADSDAILLLAGPGSGKTHTMTRRILRLLQGGIPPEEILVITFTRDAAVSMQKRFQSLTKPRVLPVVFGTFHSVFYQILRRSAAQNPPRILSEQTKKKLLYLAFSTHPLWNEHQKELLSHFPASVSCYKNTLDLKRSRTILPAKLSEAFPELFALYESVRKKEAFLDFDDMVYDCLELLRQDIQARSYWSGRFREILMDEFQDINPVQYEVIRLLKGPGTHLFAVGDDDQSIYGFRGSEPACMKRFQKEFHAKLLYLDTNYRSVPAIVDSSQRVIRENRDRFDKPAVSGVSDHMAAPLQQGSPPVSSAAPSSGVHLRAFRTQDEEYAAMADALKQAEPGPECAVLFRTNLAMQGFASTLSRQGISFRMKEKSDSIYEHYLLQDFFAYLELAHDPPQDPADLLDLYARILNTPLRYLRRESLQGPGSPLENAARYYRARIRGNGSLEALRQIRVLQNDLSFLSRQSLSMSLRYLCRKMRLDAAVSSRIPSKEKKEEFQQMLEWIIRDAAKYETMQDWREAQAAYTAVLKAAMDAKKARTDLPQLMTIHASKGLEFDTVYIPDCNEGIYPHGPLPDAARAAEERRIFYVGMTRAKKDLELWYLSGTGESPRSVSRFLNPLL